MRVFYEISGSMFAKSLETSFLPSRDILEAYTVVLNAGQ